MVGEPAGGPENSVVGPSGPVLRSQRLARLEASEFDVVVVGGGITGTAVAEEAARRGASVALIERDDFASGASGHTSKLLHGGLRYLEHGKVGLVREALRERSRLLAQLDPAWVHPIPFLLPLRGSLGSRLRNRFGTWLYERLAGGHRLGPREILDRRRVLELVPALEPQGLHGGVLYWEAIVDDVALTLFRAGSAARAGALVANHVEALTSTREPSGAFRIRASDTLTGREFSIRSRSVVDATGAWMGKVPILAENAPRLMPSKGIHLVFRREKLPINVAVVLPGPDDRPTFVLPAGSLLVMGTTDTAYRGNPGEVQAEPPDVEYLLSTLHRGFPSVPFSLDDAVDVFAGVRPLLAATASTTSELSREDVEAHDPRGAVAVAGGKLTTHRAMARRAVRLLPISLEAKAPAEGPRVRPPLPSLASEPQPISEGTELVARLVRTPRAEDWERLRARVVSALTTGQAESIEDVLDRRLHALNRRESGFETVVRAVADAVARQAGRSEESRDAAVRIYMDRRQYEYAAIKGGSNG
jgi:glycerol-3-phosphate dehydrogenase